MKSVYTAWACALVCALALGMTSAFGQEPQAEPKPLTPAQALANVEKASASYSGTRQDHIILIDSLQVLGKLVTQSAQYATLEREVIALRQYAPAAAAAPAPVKAKKK